MHFLNVVLGIDMHLNMYDVKIATEKFISQQDMTYISRCFYLALGKVLSETFT